MQYFIIQLTIQNVWQLGNADLKSMRFVNWRFREISSPLLFRNMAVDIYPVKKSASQIIMIPRTKGLNNQSKSIISWPDNSSMPYNPLLDPTTKKDLIYDLVRQFTVRYNKCTLDLIPVRFSSAFEVLLCVGNLAA